MTTLNLQGATAWCELMRLTIRRELDTVPATLKHKSFHLIATVLEAPYLHAPCMTSWEASPIFRQGRSTAEPLLPGSCRGKRTPAGHRHHLLAQFLLEMEERNLYREFGCSSVYMYAGLHLHLEGHTVAEYLRTGRSLRAFPLLAAAYQEGTTNRKPGTISKK